MTEQPQEPISSESRKSESYFGLWQLRDTLSQELLAIDKVHLNISQSLVITTEDKLLLCLQAHIEEVERSQDWIAPFTLLLSLLLAFITTDFKDFVLPKETWNAVFLIILMSSLVWLVNALKSASKKPRLDSLLKNIKSGFPINVEENSK